MFYYIVEVFKKRSFFAQKIQGEQSYTQLREANFAVIDARINEINEAIKNLT